MTDDEQTPARPLTDEEKLERDVYQFVNANRLATVSDVMMKFDISDKEANAVLLSLRAKLQHFGR